MQQLLLQDIDTSFFHYLSVSASRSLEEIQGCISFDVTLQSVNLTLLNLSYANRTTEKLNVLGFKGIIIVILGEGGIFAIADSWETRQITNTEYSRILEY